MQRTNTHPGWQRQSGKGSLFKCLFLLKNNTVVEIQSNRANTQYPSAIRAIQYACQIVVESNLIKLASVVLGNKENKYTSGSNVLVKTLLLLYVSELL
jgi:hypothetical protein